MSSRQFYDNVSNMSGTYKDMQEEIKKAPQVHRSLPTCCTLIQFNWRVSHLLLY